MAVECRAQLGRGSAGRRRWDPAARARMGSPRLPLRRPSSRPPSGRLRLRVRPGQPAPDRRRRSGGDGADVYLHFTIEAPPVITEDTRELASDIDEKALQDLQSRASERRSAWVARTASETTARAGASVELSVDTKRLYFFDPASGTSIHDTRVADTHNV